MELKPEDLVIAPWQSTPQGGWSTKPLRGVCIVHTPTGARVMCDNDMNPHRNKAEAMRLLEVKVSQLLQQQTNKHTSYVECRDYWLDLAVKAVQNRAYPSNEMFVENAVEAINALKDMK